MPSETKAIRVLIVCDQSDTAPLLGYMIREKGLNAIIETSVQRALDRAIEVMPDLIVIDVNAPHSERIALAKKYRSLSRKPVLLFLPTHHETEILEAYHAGVDECIVKPVSPAIFLAKIASWAKRSTTAPLRPLTAPQLRLNSAKRLARTAEGEKISLTNLEFRLLGLLMNRPGHVFRNEEIILAVWGISDQSDQTALKNVVYRLRKKLGDSREYMIQTSPGGYSFTED
ncbi:MAG: response regulator transcription factor [Anaerolineae bacterium]|nr:response regulator transcription factor [Anaerolineae bacterium]MBT3713838.1 response regulator transcription factor [Anaerolineae bacterium]MBT4309383.1 response regulator transcription factor [Anaerolineae bacterium]MBT4459209.1 response regulator transcription factor [Anaerolineae bacterium]MBT4840824.1 response regulator transcription factor [Anaerolineae bacterium]